MWYAGGVFWLVVILLGVVGLRLWIVGYNGRVVDDHVLCRSCRRDLYGLIEAEQCPECGQVLFRENVIVGNRERRTGSMWAGVSMVLAALGIYGLHIGLGTAGISLQKHKPVWLLQWEDDWHSIAELDRRRLTGELPPDETLRIARQFLDDQAKFDGHWNEAKGDFIAAHLPPNGLTEAESIRFAEQAVGIECSVTARWSGDELNIEFVSEDARLTARNNEPEVIGFLRNGSLVAVAQPKMTSTYGRGNGTRYCLDYVFEEGEVEPALYGVTLLPDNLIPSLQSLNRPPRYEGTLYRNGRLKNPVEHRGRELATVLVEPANAGAEDSGRRKQAE